MDSELVLNPELDYLLFGSAYIFVSPYTPQVCLKRLEPFSKPSDGFRQLVTAPPDAEGQPYTFVLRKGAGRGDYKIRGEIRLTEASSTSVSLRTHSIGGEFLALMLAVALSLYGAIRFQAPLFFCILPGIMILIMWWTFFQRRKLFRAVSSALGANIHNNQ